MSFYKLLKMRRIREMSREAEEAKGKCSEMKEIFTAGMEDILLRLRVHLGHIVVEAIY
jgi:hypothetical protein